MGNPDPQGHVLAKNLTTESVVRKMFMQGHSFKLIGESLGIKSETVSGIIKNLRQEFRDSHSEEWEEHVKMQLARLDMIESEAWSAWEESKKGKDCYETRDYKDITADISKQIVAGAGNGQKFNFTVKSEKSKGNAQFLSTVLMCVRERSKLLGLEQLNNMDTNVDNIPIISAVVETAQDVVDMEKAQRFLSVNKVPSQGE